MLCSNHAVSCAPDTYISSINVFVICAHHGSLVVRCVDKPEKVWKAISLATKLEIIKEIEEGE
jgi:hypothetical protein